MFRRLAAVGAPPLLLILGTLLLVHSIPTFYMPFGMANCRTYGGSFCFIFPLCWRPWGWFSVSACAAAASFS